MVKQMRDIYVDENTGVLINYLGITDAEELNQAESDLTIVRLKQILESPDFEYSSDALLDLHKSMFQDIYPFAGKIRKIDMEKSEKMLSGFPMIFSGSGQISKKLKKAFKEQEVDFNGNKTEVTRALAGFMGSIWEIHPFREGNTRSIITYTMKYARHNELNLDEALLLNSFAYIRDALVMYVYQEPKYLEKIILDSIERGISL